MASITTPCVVDAMRQYQQHDAVGSCSRTVDTASTAIGGLPGSTLRVIGVGSLDTFVYPRINRLEMPGPEPELLRRGATTPITLSVISSFFFFIKFPLSVTISCIRLEPSAF